MNCKRCLRPTTAEYATTGACQNCAGQTWIDVRIPQPDEENPRHLTKNGMTALKRSLKEFGLTQPIVLNTHTGLENVIVGGHQRLEAWRQIGQETIWVTYVDLPKDKMQILNVAYNKIMGDWDEDKLGQLLARIKESEYDVTLTGFDETSIDKILEKIENEDDDALEDVVPEPPSKPVSRPGDVWMIEGHRIMCGDSTKAEDVAILMGPDKADCVFTDPPYGVSYKGTNNPNGKDWGVMANDELRDDDLYEFLLQLFQNAARHTKENPALYCCYASVNHTLFEKALNEAGFQVKQVLIWEKGHVLGHSDYHWSHEPILYAIKKEHNSEWTGDRTQRTVILKTEPELETLTKEQLLECLKTIKRDSEIVHQKKDNVNAYLHSTQKPVDLPKQLIKNNTRPNHIVLDLCGGSGSTLLACEASKRYGRSMEIEPRYCDVEVIRIMNATGKEASLENGATWSKVKAARATEE